MKFGILTNSEKDKELKITNDIIKILYCCKQDVFYDADTAQALGLSIFNDAKDCDILLVLGGDGTILRAVRKYVGFNIPILGINIGHLGFMSEVNSDEINIIIDDILNGKYVIDERIMMEAKIAHSNNTLLALNDFVISRSNRTKLVRLDMYINNSFIDNYNGDGLIIATPTGSTAYSLSAGGPIVSPDMQCMVITPICAHSLYARSIVTNAKNHISICGHNNYSDIIITADGGNQIQLTTDDCIDVFCADTTVKFIRRNTDSFFAKLQNKLAQWNTNDD